MGCKRKKRKLLTFNNMLKCHLSFFQLLVHKRVIFILYKSQLGGCRQSSMMQFHVGLVQNFRSLCSILYLSVLIAHVRKAHAVLQILQNNPYMLKLKKNSNTVVCFLIGQQMSCSLHNIEYSRA